MNINQIYEIITNNIVSHINDIRDNYFSLTINIIVVVVIILFSLANRYKSINKLLQKLKLLATDENPRDYAVILTTVFLIIKIIQIFIFQLFIVDGQSMEPTLHTGNFLIVDKWSNVGIVDNIKRGEVIVFKYNNTSSDAFANGKFLVKRVLAVPGDRIVLNGSDNNIRIITASGETISPNETEIKYKSKLYPATNILLSKDEYFVMGDNRDNSYDSRYFGPIKKSNISGVVLFRVLPETTIYPGRINGVYE